LGIKNRRKNEGRIKMEKEELERQVKLYKEAWIETAKNYLYVMEKLNEAEEQIYELILENNKLMKGEI
jgi:hypothetical protein